jgi:micrococcal nuclease
MSNTDKNLYTFEGRVVKVVDGDTVDVELDLGFRITHTIRVRVCGPNGKMFNAPELRLEERERGIQAKNATVSYFDLTSSAVDGIGLKVYVKTYKTTDKYGRWIAEIHAPAHEEDLASYLVSNNLGEWTED